jgi:hypothetical protein
MDCKKEKNLKKCNCTANGCNNKGICCDCITYHRKARQLPACYFPDEAEKTYNRSVEYFFELYKEGKIK